MKTVLQSRPDFSYREDPSVPAFDDSRPVIIFDGHCVFCSGWARFVLRHDRAKRYRLIIAQTDLGTELYRHYGLDTRDYETNMLIADGRAYIKSDATLRMLSGLGLPWSLAAVSRIIPLRLRDMLYGFIARNRFRIAGRRESCYLPTPEERSRFIG